MFFQVFIYSCTTWSPTYFIINYTIYLLVMGITEMSEPVY